MKEGRVIEKVLQIAEERGEVKDNREKKRHTQLNAEFQRTVRRDESLFKRTMQRNRGKQ